MLIIGYLRFDPRSDSAQHSPATALFVQVRVGLYSYIASSPVKTTELEIRCLNPFGTGAGKCILSLVTELLNVPPPGGVGPYTEGQ